MSHDCNAPPLPRHSLRTELRDTPKQAWDQLTAVPRQLLLKPFDEMVR